MLSVNLLAFLRGLRAKIRVKGATSQGGCPKKSGWLVDDFYTAGVIISSDFGLTHPEIDGHPGCITYSFSEAVLTFWVGGAGWVPKPVLTQGLNERWCSRRSP